MYAHSLIECACCQFHHGDPSPKWVIFNELWIAFLQQCSLEIFSAYTTKIFLIMEATLKADHNKMSRLVHYAVHLLFFPPTLYQNHDEDSGLWDHSSIPTNWKPTAPTDETAQPMAYRMNNHSEQTSPRIDWIRGFRSVSVHGSSLYSSVRNRSVETKSGLLTGNKTRVFNCQCSSGDKASKFVQLASLFWSGFSNISKLSIGLVKLERSKQTLTLTERSYLRLLINQWMLVD